MGAGVVDHQQIAHGDLGQLALDGELVAVLAQGADDVVGLRGGGGFLAQHGDVVVGAVHAGAHEVGHGGVHADVGTVGVLPAEGAGDEPAVGAGDGAAAFHVDGERIEAGGDDELVVPGARAAGDGGIVHGPLFGPVGDADAAAGVDEGNADAEAVLELDGQLEQHAGGFDVVLGVEFVGDDHGVQAERLHAEVAGAGVGGEELVAGEAVLGLLGMADDGVARLGRAGVVAETEGFGQGTGGGDERVDVRDIIEVDDGAELAGLAEFGVGGFVGGEHDAVAGQADGLAEAEFGEGGAIGAAALGGEELQDEGIGRGLDGEEFAEGGEDGKRLVQALRVLPDRRLVVEVEGGGEALREGFGLFAGEGEGFHDESRISN